MRFRYYITELFNGTVTGTDKKAVAEDYAELDECFVVDSDTGMWLTGGGEEHNIKDVEGDY